MLNKKTLHFITTFLALVVAVSSCYFPFTMEVVLAKDATQGGVLSTNADEDAAANQTFDSAKLKGANSEALAAALKALPEKVENNSKVKDKMTELGDQTKVEVGKIKEITEFGGWTAIDGGKFAIVKQTADGFFPIGAINVTRAAGNEGGKEEAFVQESVLDKTNPYSLLLGKCVTGANRNEEAHNDTPYKPSGEGKTFARNVKGFKGIEKIFKAYSPETGSLIRVGFKIGYTGDIDGRKAQYKVDVLAHTKEGKWDNVYTKTFNPTDNNEEVKPAKDGTIRELDVTGLTKDKAEEKIKKENRVPNGTVGTFLSKEIQLPVGATEYKVQISIGDQDRIGMSYQSKYELYALPVSGTDFNVTQDTRQLAKSLFTQIYNKLLEEKAEAIKNKTPESIAAYEAELEKMKALVDSTKLKSKTEYLEALATVKEKQNALESEALDLVAPTTKVAVKNPAQLTEQEKQAVKKAVKDANPGLNLDDNDITVDSDGKVTVTKDGKTGTIEGASVVEESKALDLVAPTTKVAVKNPAQLTEQEKQAVKKAVKDANPGLNLDDNDITVDSDGKVTVTKDGKTSTIEAGNVVEAETNNKGTSSDTGSWITFSRILPKEQSKEQEKKEVVNYKAYIFGYEDGCVRPMGNITRGEAAAMVARLMNYDLTNTAKPNFSDVSGWYNSAINAVVNAGIMKGYQDGSFKPDAPISRAEFAQLIKGIDKVNRREIPFTDVNGHWAKEAIAQAYANGRIAGYPNGTFKPDQKITRAEAARILNGVFNRAVRAEDLKDIKSMKQFKDLDKGAWYYLDMVAAINSYQSPR